MSDNQIQIGGQPNKQLQVFNNPQFGNVRTSVDEKGEPWFCLNDVCNCLNLKNPSHVSERLEGYGIISNYITDSLGREQEALFVNEENLYACIFQSRKKEAKVFQRWVFSEVLPTLRKTGHYELNSTATSMPRINNLAEAFEYMAKQEREKMEQQQVIEQQSKQVLLLENKAEEQEKKLDKAREIYKAERPKVAFADAYVASEQSELISNFAKILAQNGVKTGEKRFYQYLRDNHYLCEKGDAYNKPTQKSIERGFFEVESRTIISGTRTIITSTTKITPEGQKHFINKLLNKQKNNGNN